MSGNPISRSTKAMLTDTEIANIIFNEIASFSGDGIDETRVALANAVINRDERFGETRPSTAPEVINRGLSMLERGVLAKIGAVIMPRVRAQRAVGVVTAGGNNFLILEMDQIQTLAQLDKLKGKIKAMGME